MSSLVLRTGVVAVLLAAAGAGQYALLEHLSAVEEVPPTPLAQPLAALPAALGPWSGEDKEIEEQLMIGDDRLSRVYVDGPRGQKVTLWMVYSGTGEDRQHHPEICMAVAGQPEDPGVRQTLAVPGDPHPVQQYRFGRTGKSQWVFYWHYTLPAAAAEGRELSAAQQLHRKLRRKTGSVTIEVFAPESAPTDVEGARDFVRLVDAAVRKLVPEGSVRGSERVPVKYVGGAGG
ncbi:MAG: exosortase-associated EpsI family protein [Planctomycetales bacterium]